MELDNRGLTPPEPMVRILSAVAEMQETDVLIVLNDRRPIHLYPVLADRGCSCETEDLPGGGVRLRITRKQV